MTIADLEAARRMHRAGRLEEALEMYREVTRVRGGEAEPWLLRAMAEQQAGNFQDAWNSIASALKIDGARPHAHLVAGHIAEDMRDIAVAEASFRRAIELSPNWVAAWNSLGMLLFRCGRADEAAVCFRRALDLDPQNVGAWRYLGVSLKALGQLDEAVRALNHAVTLDPRRIEVYLDLSRTYEAMGKDDLALSTVQSALRLAPRNAPAHFVAGDLQRRRREFEAARQSYLEAESLSPSNPEPGNALADMLWEMGRAEEARARFAVVARSHPASFRAALGAHLVLPAVYTDEKHLQEARRGYQTGLSALLEAADRFEHAGAAEALEDATWTNFYLAYQGANDREPQSRYGELIASVLDASVPEWRAPRPRSPRARGKLRVGFFSHFFFNSTVGRYFASWVRELDPARFEKVVYYTNRWVADDTRAIAAAAQAFRHMPLRSTIDFARQILADDLDVLIYPELGMHAASFTLASLRLAPVQIAGWGHPTTTGLPTIDYFLSCESMEPHGADAHYSERLALLPGIGTRYGRPLAVFGRTRANFGLPEQARLYLVPQSLFKIHPDNDSLLAHIVARDPQGMLVMFKGAHEVLADRFATRLEREFQALGTSVSDRVLFLPFMPHADYLALNSVCDVMLDTLHWSGGNTSLDAIASGLPVVTLPGGLMRGRQTLGMLRMMGIPELVAANQEDYVEKAVSIARDREHRHALSAKMQDANSVLFDREEPIRALEAFIEKAAAQA